MTLTVTFIDAGRFPTQKPDPKFPEGIDVDLTNGRKKFCSAALPYPAPRCGMLVVRCDVCGTDAVITTAGRIDDPRSIKMPCKETVQ